MGIYEILLAFALSLGSCVFYFKVFPLLGIKRTISLLLLIWVSGFAGAMIHYHFAYQMGFPGNPGISVLGAVASTTLCYFLFGRFFSGKTFFWVVFEKLAESAPWGLALGRLACLYEGCCLSVFGWGHSGEIAILLGLGVWNYFWGSRIKKHRLSPSPQGIFLAVYGLMRFIIEIFRLDASVLSLRLSIIVFLSGFVVDWIRIQRHNNAP